MYILNYKSFWELWNQKIDHFKKSKLKQYSYIKIQYWRMIDMAIYRLVARFKGLHLCDPLFQLFRVAQIDSKWLLFQASLSGWAQHHAEYFSSSKLFLYALFFVILPTLQHVYFLFHVIVSERILKI